MTSLASLLHGPKSNASISTNKSTNRRFQGRVTFANLAHHYMQNELSEQADTVDPKARTTIYIYRHILNDYLIPRWGRRIALGIEPLEIEQWLQALRREKCLANPTLD